MFESVRDKQESYFWSSRSTSTRSTSRSTSTRSKTRSTTRSTTTPPQKKCHRVDVVDLVVDVVDVDLEVDLVDVVLDVDLADIGLVDVGFEVGLDLGP